MKIKNGGNFIEKASFLDFEYLILNKHRFNIIMVTEGGFDTMNRFL